jgi:O-antigen ligase
MKTFLVSAVAALTLIGSQAAATSGALHVADRAAPATAESDQMMGMGSNALGLLLALIALGVIVLVVNQDDNPSSP